MKYLEEHFNKEGRKKGANKKKKQFREDKY